MSTFTANDSSILTTRLNRVQWTAIAVGILCLLACLLIGTASWALFLRAYLEGYLFWLGISLGSLALLMLHHLTGGQWGQALRRMAEAAALTLPLMLLMFVPLALGLRHLYPWADPEQVHHSHALMHKAAYLNGPMVLLRSGLFLLSWSGFAVLLARAASRWQTTGDPSVLNRLQRLSAGGLVLYAVTMSLASVDWIMSRDTQWFSTLFGLLVLVGQSLSAMAFLVLFLPLLLDRRPLREFRDPHVLRDLGNLLLVLVILWAYLAFAQLLVIWMGNTKEEITWYTQRGLGNAPSSWRWVGLGLIVLHFFVPFLLLLFRFLKQRIRMLASIAALLLAMRLVDMYWMIAPSGPHLGPRFDMNLLDLLAPLGIGGVWLAVFIGILRRGPLVPLAEETPHEA